MAEYRQVLLDASTTDVLYGTPIETTGLKEVFLEFLVETTAATLSASVVLTGGLQKAVALQPYANLEFTGASTITPSPAGWSIINNFFVTWTNPAIGLTRAIIRMPNPPKYISPYYDYVSGGGTVRVRIIAWGWGTSTVFGRTLSA